MFKVPDSVIGKYVKAHFGPEFNFAGIAKNIDKETNTLELFNATGSAIIHADIAQIVTITVVKEREATQPSPHYNVQYETPYYPEQVCYPPATQTRLNNSAYRKR